ncbi:MAG: hypothetical protein AAGI37_09760 [Planctomycetota bacterium]
MLKRLMKKIQPVPILVLALVTIIAMPSVADSLQREGFPLIDGVTLIGVEEGKLKYRTAAGDRAVDLTDVVTLSIDAVPEFKAGLDAIKAGELRAAQRSLENVWSGARAAWIKHYAGYFLVQVYDQRGEPVDAAAIYSKLAAEDADPYFLSKAPVASLEEADDNQRERIGEQIMAVVRESEGEQRRLLRAYHRQVVGVDAPLPEVDDPVGKQEAKANQARAESKAIMPDAVWKMLERKNEPEGKWDAIELLAKGDAKGTLEAIKPWLSNPGDMPEKLFIKGIAQLMLADQAEDKDMYRDAGLTFMRIVIHFDRAGQAHPLVAPARLEVAYVHKQIEREDIYNRILFGGDEGGGVHLVIDDAQAYPEYRKRYYQIIGEELPEDDQP